VMLMWLAEIVDGHGFGDGAAILLVTPIAAVLPGEFWEIRKSKGFGVFALALAVVVATVVFKVCFDRAQRKIPTVPYSHPGASSSRRGSSSSSSLPLKLSQQETAISAAAVVLFLPVLAVRLWPGHAVLEDLQNYLHEGSDPWYLAAFLVLIVVFTVTEARFVLLNPQELAGRLLRSSVFIPGVAPGGATRRYLSQVFGSVTAVRAFYLVISALIPIFGFAMLGADAVFPYGAEAVVLSSPSASTP
jgi:preprotein translocase subunit SecY